MKSDSEIDRLVEVDADLLLDARLVAHDLAGRDAAHRDLALAGAEVLHGEAADVGGDALDVLDAALAQRLLGRAPRPRTARRAASARACVAVTVISSLSVVSSVKSTGCGSPAATSTVCVLVRKPGKAAATITSLAEVQRK